MCVVGSVYGEAGHCHADGEEVRYWVMGWCFALCVVVLCSVFCGCDSRVECGGECNVVWGVVCVEACGGG